MTWRSISGLNGEARPSAGDWLARLSELAAICAEALAEDETDCVREAFDLLCQMPQGRRLLAGSLSVSEAEIEAMLAAGATESAALALLPADAGFMLSRGPNGLHLATVLLPDFPERHGDACETAALALLAALLGAVSLQERNQAGCRPTRLN